MSIAELKETVQREWYGVPAVELCLRLLDFVDRMPSAELRMLTFRELVSAVGEKAVTPDLLTALAILTNPQVHVFDARALFVDEGGEETEIEPEELAEAHESGELVHPITGAIIKDFSPYIVPFFSLTDEARIQK